MDAIVSRKQLQKTTVSLVASVSGNISGKTTTADPQRVKWSVCINGSILCVAIVNQVFECERML